MNYIHQLQEAVDSGKHIRKDARGQVQDIISYLCSSKFQCGDSMDGYVNINDLIPRLRQIQLTLSEDL